MFFCCKINQNPTNRYIFFSLALLAVLSALISFFSYFTVDEKEICNVVIEETIKECKIKRTSDTIAKLIDSSEEISCEGIRVLKILKRHMIFPYTKGIFLGILGVFVGFISSEISKEGINYAEENFNHLIELGAQIVACSLHVYVFLYAICKAFNRNVDLYVQVLKDLKLTIELKEE